jgi:hypothetical protein
VTRPAFASEAPVSFGSYESPAARAFEISPETRSTWRPAAAGPSALRGTTMLASGFGVAPSARPAPRASPNASRTSTVRTALS